MSIISDFIDCPQCGLPSQKDNYHVTGEEMVVCNWCGYSHTKTVEMGTKIKHGYGSIHYVPKSENENGSNEITIVRLDKPLSLLERHQIIMDIEANYDKLKSGLFIWDETKYCLECLIGSRPKTIDEEYQERLAEIRYEQMIKDMSSQIMKDYTDF